MQPIDELTTTLNRYFQWNKARMDCFVGILIGLLKLSSPFKVGKHSLASAGTGF